MQRGARNHDCLRRSSQLQLSAPAAAARLQLRAKPCPQAFWAPPIPCPFWEDRLKPLESAASGPGRPSDRARAAFFLRQFQWQLERLLSGRSLRGSARPLRAYELRRPAQVECRPHLGPKAVREHEQQGIPAQEPGLSRSAERQSGSEDTSPAGRALQAVAAERRARWPGAAAVLLVPSLGRLRS